MTKNNQFFTQEEVLEAMVEILQEDFTGDAFDLSLQISIGPYIVGTTQAEAALIQYGVFKAIQEIAVHEEENYGSVETDLTNPEDVATMLYMKIAQEIVYSIVETAVGSLGINNKEDAQKVIEFIKNR